LRSVGNGMKLSLHSSVVWLALVCGIGAIGRPSVEQGLGTQVEHHFGIQLVPNYSDAITFSVVTTKGSAIIRVRHLSKNSFVRMITGEETSAANAEGIDLLRANGISSANTIHTLWKLRYPEHPYRNDSKQGWANGKSAPDAAQLNMLSAFGINNLHDICYGERLFSLLRALEDEPWLARYR